MNIFMAGLTACALALMPSQVTHAAHGGLAGDEEVLLIMKLLDVSDPQEISEQELEHFRPYLDHPLEINSASRSRLLASGIFSPYQIASLLDYRSRNGDILSLTELSLLDGFSAAKTEAAAPFISLRSHADAGRSTPDTLRLYNDLVLRTASRLTGREGEYNYGLKYIFRAGERMQFALAADRNYDARHEWPARGSFHLAYFGRRHLGKIVLGDYNLKYAQGLMLWNAFRMSSLDSPDAFFLRATGISPYCSFSGESGERGVAADFNLGSFVLSASMGVDGLRKLMLGRKDAGLALQPALNLARHGRMSTLSVSVLVRTADFAVNGKRSGTNLRGSVQKTGSGLSEAKVGADFKVCIKGVDVLGEAVYDVMGNGVSALSGVLFPVTDMGNMAFRGTYTDEEQSVAAGGRFQYGGNVNLAGRSGFGSSVRRMETALGTELLRNASSKYGADGANFRWKFLLTHKYQMNPRFALHFRLSERLRPDGNRIDVRCDLKYDDAVWNATLRANALHCKSPALLGYAEAGWKQPKIAAYLRAGIFRIDTWDDRIYVYERDAPGSFNLPAYYGRGCWFAANLSWKPARSFALYLRLSSTLYPRSFLPAAPSPASAATALPFAAPPASAAAQAAAQATARPSRTECRLLVRFTL